MKKIFFLLIISFPAIVVPAQVSVKNLRLENRINPVGMDVPTPRFSWQLVSGKRNLMQTAFEIRVTDKSGKSIIWNSGKQITDQSVYVPYSGDPLQSAMTYYWQVRVWDNQGNTSGWSDRAFWQTGLLVTNDWKAKWIESGSPADSVNGPALLFRKSFLIKKKIISATVFVTAHGMYEASLNGKKIGDAFLTPGWTSYNKRLQYQAYDITDLMAMGENVIGMNVGSGWYRTPLAWNDNKNLYGKKLGLLLQVNIIYSDGSRETVLSDSSWKTTDRGPIRFSEIYNGEILDARQEIPDWNKAGFDDHSWQPVIEKDYVKSNLIGTYNEPVLKHESFQPLRIFKSPKGEQIIDFGQNLVGWAQFRVQGKAGDRIIVEHAEVLDKNGNFYTENLRAAKATDTYILQGKGEEFFEPHFTFHGFRYLRVQGFPGEIKPENITAVTLYSNMHPSGQFTCSNPMLNQLQHNIQWGQKGNFLDVPTDCPQRDERLGWTGDAQAFSRTACFNMDVHNFFSKWMKDVAADQSEDGRVPFVVPNVLGTDGWWFSGLGRRFDHHTLEYLARLWRSKNSGRSIPEHERLGWFYAKTQYGLFMEHRVSFWRLAVLSACR